MSDTGRELDRPVEHFPKCNVRQGGRERVGRAIKVPEKFDLAKIGREIFDLSVVQRNFSEGDRERDGTLL